MTIKTKITLILLCVFILFGIVNYGIQHFIIFPSFLSLERKESIKNTERSFQAIQREIHHLDLLCFDWAAWDDTYEFIESPSDEYIKSNLVLTAFTGNRINTIYFVDTNGKVIWGENYDLEDEIKINLAEFPKDAFPVNHPLISCKSTDQSLEETKINGVVLTLKGPMLVSTRPIINSNYEGPIRGFLIFGRLLNDEIIKTLVEQTQVDFQIFPSMDGTFHESIKDIPNRLTGESRYLTEVSSNDSIDSYTTFSDINGGIAFLIKSQTPRTISKEGYATIQYALYSILAAVIVVFIMMFLILHYSVLGPIAEFTKRVVLIGKTGDLSTSAAIHRQDEIGILASEFDNMLGQVKNIHGELEHKVSERTAELTLSNEKLYQEIKERKKAEQEARESEEKLARSKRMESLGLLAGGVAHDLNNILVGIVNYPELLLRDIPEQSIFRKPIETMQKSGHKAVAVVQDLLTVARGVATTKESLNLNDLINDYLNSPEFLQLTELFPGVMFKNSRDKDLFNIRGSHIHIRKLVMNLISNAFEAVLREGTVTISTMNRYLDRPLRGYDNVTIGEYVILSVSDNGPGISSSDLERIFEPFYTKKVIGRSGTGLGLTVVWNTVQDHKGYIDVTSNENGTTFELYFPITREKVSDKTMSIPIKEYMGNQEVILVIDDEEIQREIACKMLGTLGYKAIVVSSGEEAVEYLKEHTVDLILLDMIMTPGITGRETYEKIVEIHPNQKALILSGFAETNEVKAVQKLGAGKYLKKPVRLENLGIAIKEELER
ncbi:CHASE4 domain-containing protein [Thermodesulfobacteriota bacterium]